MATELPSHNPLSEKIRQRQIEVGHRLRKLRLALGMGSVAAAAQKLGVNRERWQNWEAGRGMPPPHQMLDLVEIQPEICLNYLYSGRIGSLSPRLRRLLRENGGL